MGFMCIIWCIIKLYGLYVYYIHCNIGSKFMSDHNYISLNIPASACRYRLVQSRVLFILFICFCSCFVFSRQCLVTLLSHYVLFAFVFLVYFSPLNCGQNLYSYLYLVNDYEQSFICIFLEGPAYYKHCFSAVPSIFFSLNTIM